MEKVMHSERIAGNIMQDTNKAVVDFFTKTLGCDSAKVVGMEKIPDGWTGQVKVLEENTLIAKLGISAKVYDKLLYDIKLDDNLEVLYYGHHNKED